MLIKTTTSEPNAHTMAVNEVLGSLETDSSGSEPDELVTSQSNRSGTSPLSPISAIVPACERIESLLKTLTRIHACVPRPDEILVHVDGANAKVMEAVGQNFPDVRLLSSPTLQGPGGARNKLIDEARHEWVANFDDDSFPQDADYFAKALELTTLFPAAAILSAANHDDKASFDRFTQISAASGCGCIFRKSWYLKVGGFVPLPIAYNMEEVDMGLRLHAIGGLIVRDDELRVIHDKPPPTEVSAETNACILANTALLPLLRFPIWLWPVGGWQVLHRVLYLIGRGWIHGLFKGLRMIPSHLQKHISWRDKIASSSIISWLILRHFPRSLPPCKSTRQS